MIRRSSFYSNFDARQCSLDLPVRSAEEVAAGNAALVAHYRDVADDLRFSRAYREFCRAEITRIEREAQA